MPVSHVDAAIRTDNDVVGLVELAIGVAGFARRAQAQKLFTLRAELVDLMPFRPGRVAGKVRNPDVALAIHADAVGCHHHALAEVRQDRAAVAIELEDRVHEVGIA